MKKEYLGYVVHATSTKLLSLILVTVIPIVLLLIYNNHCSRETLLRQVEDTHYNMLCSYRNQLDDQLNLALAYSLNLTINENDPQIITRRRDEASIQYAKLRINTDMSEKLLNNHFLNGYFLYAKEQDGSACFLHSSNPSQPICKTQELQPYILSYIQEGKQETKWHFCTINNEQYLLLTVQKNDSLCAGAYANITFLLDNFLPDNISGNQLFLFPSDELAAFTDGLSDDEQITFCYSDCADLVLAETFSRSAILDSLPFMQKYTLVISSLVIILVVILLLSIQRIVTLPLLRLASAMYHIQNGDFDYRIPPAKVSTEIDLINNTFNHMAGDIEHLKINVYEEQLNVQKSQLRNLQLQIKPHFLINSLNMVHNLIETNQLPLARQLIIYSIDYFRYMVRVDQNLVPLNEEIAHVKAYLEIQSIRYLNRFTYSVKTDPMVDDMLVPPIMIQNLVENSMKYSLFLSHILHINIQVSSFEKDYFPYARIVISDSGQGFPPDQLKYLNQGEKIIKKDGEHIGIHNTIQRLNILFAGKASWRFYNEAGAVCEITLPATFLDTEEDSEIDRHNAAKNT